MPRAAAAAAAAAPGVRAHGATLVLLVAVVALALPAARAATVFVDAGATGSNNGSSWANAKTDLRQALNQATSGDELWVKAGTYRPGSGSTDRTRAFVLKAGVAAYGGFAGTETARSQRSVATNVVVLDGTMSGGAGGNSYHVVYADQNSGGAVLDGFTIRNGEALSAATASSNTPWQYGGGLYCSGAQLSTYASISFTVNSCTFENNTANVGGAMYLFERCNPTVSASKFIGNSAQTGTFMGGSGGAVAAVLNVTATFSSCTFERNTATRRGGAMFIDYGSSMTLNSLNFTLNSVAHGLGGAVYATDRNSQIGATTPRFTSTVFDRNSVTSGYGGGMAVFTAAQPSCTSCTFTNNYASLGGGAVAYQSSTSVTLTSATYSGNTKSGGATSNSEAFSTPSVSAAANAAGFTYSGMLYALWNRSASVVTELAQAATVLYVDGSVTASGAGTSWATAYKTLQEALDASSSGTEIWVRGGQAYVPTTKKPSIFNSATQTGSRYLSIQLTSQVAVYGGFAGTETARAQRNWYAHPTILSGDIGTVGVATDNAYHVVWGAQGARLDGFVVTGGYAEGDGQSCSSGGNTQSTSTSALTCGLASGTGGGMANFLVATTVVNTVFVNNWAGKGGAVYNIMSTQGAGSSFTNCAFYGNAASRGGCMSNDINTIALSYVIFQNCSCDGKGGGIYNDFFADNTVTGCTFRYNSAYEAGGATVNDGRASANYTDTQMCYNSAFSDGGAIYQGSYNPMDTYASSRLLAGTVLRDNSATFGRGNVYNWADDVMAIAASGVSIDVPSASCGVAINASLTDPSISVPSSTSAAGASSRAGAGALGVSVLLAAVSALLLLL